MPPNIVDIVIKAVGAGFAWLTNSVDIVIKATPDWGIPFIVMCGFFLLMAWWFLEPERR